MRNDEPQYAPAAGPVSPDATRTSAEGLATRDTTLSRDGTAVPLYAAWPENVPHRPVIIVICEAFGLHEHIKDIVRRFAHAGYMAIAPDLMVRQGDPMKCPNTEVLVKELLLKIPDDQVMADLDASVAWAAAQGGDTGALFATGFCWGGRWTWLYAAHRPLKAAVAWYGILDGTASGLFPNDPTRFPSHPIDDVDELKAPVLGLYGAQDQAIGIDTVEAMRFKLAHGSPSARQSSIVVYQDAGHAFFADYRESYVPVAAQDAWQLCLEHFRINPAHSLSL